MNYITPHQFKRFGPYYCSIPFHLVPLLILKFLAVHSDYSIRNMHKQQYNNYHLIINKKNLSHIKLGLLYTYLHTDLNKRC